MWVQGQRKCFSCSSSHCADNLEVQYNTTSVLSDKIVSDRCNFNAGFI